MFGKKFSEYIQFQKWILILIVVVYALRLGLSLAGVPVSEARWVSINLVLLVGLVYCSIAVQTRNFGGYKHLFGLLLVQIAFAHLLIALAITLAVVTGTQNIYTTPEYSPTANGATWGHAALHVLAGFIAPLVSWAIGSIILFVTRRLKPGK